MKTTRIILGILGLVLASFSFGQLISPNEISEESDVKMGHRLDRDSEVLFYTADYNKENGRLEHWVQNLPGRDFHSASRNEFVTPIVARTYFVNDIEISYEDELVMENWMIVPFESYIAEAEIWIEPWMTTPFDEYYTEEELIIESWMVTPFENSSLDADIELEAWMTTLWI